MSDIDQQVRCAALTGVPLPLIAERLGITERHVRRILHTLGVGHCTPNPLVGTDHEPLLWELWRSMGDRPAVIAYRFCRSRETVLAYFRQPRQIDGDTVHIATA